MGRLTWVGAAFATVAILIGLKLAGPVPVTASVPGQARTAIAGHGVEQTPWHTMTHVTTNFRIRYSLDAANHPNDAITTARAELLGEDFEAARAILVGTYGFSPPPVAGRIDVVVGDIVSGNELGVSSGGTIVLDPQLVRASAAEPHDYGAVHELFHEIQRAYKAISPANQWVDEGLAVLVSDQVFSDTDTSSVASFRSWVDEYLGDPEVTFTDDDGVARVGLLNSDYRAALFWKYFAERFGTTPLDSTGYHINAIETFYDAYEHWGPTTAIEAAISVLASPMTLEEVYRDFILTNYTKDYSYLPKYAYRDDDATPYRAVAKLAQFVDPLGASPIITIADQGFGVWGARYYEFLAGLNCPYLQVQATPTDGTSPFFQLVSRNSTTVLGVETEAGNPVNRTFYAAGGTQVAGVALIASSESSPVSFTISSRCVVPAVTINAPSASNKAYGGDPLTPETFMIELSVLANGAAVAGLESSAFTVTVGGIPAVILSAASVQDEYWLVVQAPAQVASTTYALSVGLVGAGNDTENNSVLYNPRPVADQILVIDNSSSMLDEDKLGAARNAAQLYIDVTHTEDRVGVVTFSTASRMILPLTPANFLGKGLAILATDMMVGDGATCIGCGAQTAQTELDGNGNDDHYWNIILLSDGRENVAPFWNDVRNSITATQTVIDTVFLGPADADAEFLMQRIAKETNGRYNRVFLDSEGFSAAGVRSAASVSNTPLPNRLADVYKAARERIEHQDRFYETSGFMSANLVSNTKTITFEAALREATVAVNWDRESLNPTLTRPDGTLVAVGDADVIEIRNGATHRNVRLRNPMAGAWVVGFQPNADINYMIIGSGRSATDFYTILGLPEERRIVGADMPLLATLVDTAPITGARVFATVQGPDSRLNFRLRLFDDGKHGDGKRNDGVYGTNYPLTRLAGSYHVDFSAEGVNHSGQAFTRYDAQDFSMLGGPDHDGDGLPTLWEIFWGFHPFNPQYDDAESDSDDDGLNNFQEFFLGTNPRNPDTDGGGESDLSEVRNRRNPFDDTDDRMRTPRWLRALVRNGAVAVNYELPLSATDGILARFVVTGSVGVAGLSTLADSGLVTFTVGPSGVFTDTTAQNGVTYRYQLVARGADGSLSRPGPAVVVRPSGTPPPPTRRYIPLTPYRSG